MAKKQQKGADDPSTPYDWGTSGKRVEWLLNARFTGNRSEMARAIGFSHAAVGQVVSGAKPPGGRMMTAIVEKLGVDAEWLMRGRGEPFGAKLPAVEASHWMPASDRLFSDRLPKGLRELSDRTFLVPVLRPSSQYWFRLKKGEPILAKKARGFLANDLLLMETDPAKFPTEERLSDRLCAVKSPPGSSPPVRLGAVEFTPADVEDGPARLEVDVFDAPAGRVVRDFIFREHPDGTIERLEQLLQKHVRDGRVKYRPLTNMAAGGVLRRINYADVVAVWTGIMLRRDQATPA